MATSIIPRLADHFRTTLQNHKPGQKQTLSIPADITSALRTRIAQIKSSKTGLFTAPEIDDFVYALAEGGSWWGRLDSLSFEVMIEVCVNTEPCVAQSVALWKLYKTVEARDRENQIVPVEERRRFLEEVGEKAVGILYGFLINTKAGSTVSRRWAGFLLLELLEHEMSSKKLMADIKDARVELGKLVVEGRDKILKVIAGKLITRLTANIDNLDRRIQLVSTFLPTGYPGLGDSAGKEFPLISGSQWESDFGNYVGEIENIRDEMNVPNPMGFSTAIVQVGTHYLGESGGNTVALDVTMLSIYIPGSNDKPPVFYDIATQNIEIIKLEGVHGAPPDQTTGMVLHLRDFDELGYLYLHNMKESSDVDVITLEVFLEEATFIVNELQMCRDTRRKQINPNYVSNVSKPPEDIFTGSFMELSQEDAEEQLRARRDQTQKDVQSAVDTLLPNVKIGEEDSLDEVTSVEEDSLDEVTSVVMEVSLPAPSPPPPSPAEPATLQSEEVPVVSRTKPDDLIKNQPLRDATSSKDTKLKNNIMGPEKDGSENQQKASTEVNPPPPPSPVTPAPLKQTKVIKTKKSSPTLPKRTAPKPPPPSPADLDIFDFPGSEEDDETPLPLPKPKKGMKVGARKPGSTRASKTTKEKPPNSRKGKSPAITRTTAISNASENIESAPRSIIPTEGKKTPASNAPAKTTAALTPPDSRTSVHPAKKKPSRTSKARQSKGKSVAPASQEDFVPEVIEQASKKRKSAASPAPAGPVRRSARIQKKVLKENLSSESEELTSPPDSDEIDSEDDSRVKETENGKVKGAKSTGKNSPPESVMSENESLFSEPESPVVKRKAAVSKKLAAGLQKAQVLKASKNADKNTAAAATFSTDVINEEPLSFLGANSSVNPVEKPTAERKDIISTKSAETLKVDRKSQEKLLQSVQGDDFGAKELPVIKETTAATQSSLSRDTDHAVSNEIVIRPMEFFDIPKTLTEAEIEDTEDLSFEQIEKLMDEVTHHQVDDTIKAGRLDEGGNKHVESPISGTKTHSEREAFQFQPIVSTEIVPEGTTSRKSVLGLSAIHSIETPPVPPPLVEKKLPIPPPKKTVVPEPRAQEKNSILVRSLPSGSSEKQDPRAKEKASKDVNDKSGVMRAPEKKAVAPNTLARPKTKNVGPEIPPAGHDHPSPILGEPEKSSDRPIGFRDSQSVTPESASPSSTSPHKNPEIIVLEKLPPGVQMSAQRILQRASIARKPQIIAWDDNGPKNQGEVRLEVKTPAKVPQQRKILVVPKSAIKAEQEHQIIGDGLLGLSGSSDTGRQGVSHHKGWSTPDIQAPNAGTWALGKFQLARKPKTPSVTRSKLRRSSKRPLLETSSDEDLYSVPPPKKKSSLELPKSQAGHSNNLEEEYHESPGYVLEPFQEGELDSSPPFQIDNELGNTGQIQRTQTVNSSGSPFPKQSQSQSQVHQKTTSAPPQDNAVEFDNEQSAIVDPGVTNIGHSEDQAILITSGEEKSSDDEEEEDDGEPTAIPEPPKRRENEDKLIKIKKEAGDENLPPFRKENIRKAPGPALTTRREWEQTKTPRDSRKIILASPFETDQFAREKKDSVKDSKQNGKRPHEDYGGNPFESLFKRRNLGDTRLPEKEKVPAVGKTTGGLIPKPAPRKPVHPLVPSSAQKTVRDIAPVRRSSQAIQDMLQISANRFLGPVKDNNSEDTSRHLRLSKTPLLKSKASGSAPVDDDKSSKIPLSLEQSALRTLQDSESRKTRSGGSKKPATQIRNTNPRNVTENTTLIRSKNARGNNIRERETSSERQGRRFLAEMDLQGLLSFTTREDNTIEKLDHDTPAPPDINQGYITSGTSDSLSDLDDDEEYFSVPEEDPESWISRLPERHQDTAVVLTKITKSLLSFLMTAEERADLALKDYEAKTDMVVKKLKELHHDEYAAFLEEYQNIRNKVLEEGEGVARELGEIGEGLKTGIKAEEAVGKAEEEYKGLVDRLKGVMEI